MIVPFSSIYVDPDRIREAKGDLSELKGLLKAHGQLLPILVKPSSVPDKPYKLIDGERRLLSLIELSAMSLLDIDLRTQLESKGIQIGHIEIKLQRELDPFEAKLQEWAANGGREAFSWQENAKMVNYVHSEKKKQNPKWTAQMTGVLLGISDSSVGRYLALTEEPEVFTSERVQNAASLNTAVKQAQIQREVSKRVRLAKHHEATVSTNVAVQDRPDYMGLARRIVSRGDAREWIKTIPTESLAWFHWDPPYGTREGSGGAFSSHEGVETDAVYCFKLMYEMLPEIYRVLKPGAWFVMWYSHIFYEPIRRMLQGHRWVPTVNGTTCKYCNREIGSYELSEGHYKCALSPHAFWTNPFPNYWLKTGVGNDGHEIKRFLKKDTEPFLFACKSEDPILPFSSRGNVFTHSVPLGESRRHVNQKPANLLQEILQVISVSGEVGGDAGVGSGTIIEAAFGSGRRVVGCDISEANWATSVGIAEKCLESNNIRSLSFAPWLVSHDGN